MSMTATAQAHMMEENDGSSVFFRNHHALRRPVAVSLLLHAAVFTGLLAWWQTEGAPAPRGVPDGLSVTFIELSDPSPAPAAPQVKAAPVEQPRPQIQPVPDMPEPVVEKLPEPLIPVRPEVALETKPEPRPEPARPVQQQEAAPAMPQQTAALAPSVLHTGTGQGAPRGFKETDGEKTEEVFITDVRYRVPPRPPVYPRRAQQLEQEGEALVRVKIDPSGHPAEVIVMKSSGYVLLDHAAIKAVSGWQFEPERRGGKPVVAWAQIPVRFVLN